MLGLRTQAMRLVAYPTPALALCTSAPCLAIASKTVLPHTSVSQTRNHSILVSHPHTATIRSSTPTRAASTSAAAEPPSNPNDGSLSWNAYLRLRRIRRRFNLISSVSTAITGFGAGLSILSQQNMEQLGQVMFGMDPMFVAGLWSLGFITVGWLVGPVVGTGVFRLMYRRQLGEMSIKERNFFERIRKYRVDPSSSSVQNPVPDYYGEKITSVAGYRQWLKDQRAFNKKRQSFV